MSLGCPVRPWLTTNNHNTHKKQSKKKQTAKQTQSQQLKSLRDMQWYLDRPGDGCHLASVLRSWEISGNYDGEECKGEGPTQECEEDTSSMVISDSTFSSQNSWLLISPYSLWGTFIP